MEILSINNLQKNYGNLNILKGINFKVKTGEFISIMGQSGSGKTTLLNLLSTIDKPTSGEILCNGIKIEKLKGKKLSKFRGQKIGMIFQDYNLFDSIKIYDNIALPMNIQNFTKKHIKEKIKKLSKILQIDNLLNKYPNELSGGQKQRVAIARALSCDPEIIFADEPTGALDTKNTEIVLDLLHILNKEFKKTILMVTHSPDAASYSDRVIFIKDGKLLKDLYKNSNLIQEEFYQEILNYIVI